MDGRGSGRVKVAVAAEVAVFVYGRLDAPFLRPMKEVIVTTLESALLWLGTFSVGVAMMGLVDYLSNRNKDKPYKRR